MGVIIAVLIGMACMLALAGLVVAAIGDEMEQRKMSVSPKAPPPIEPADAMRTLLRELRAIEKSGRTVHRAEWYRLARRFVIAKRYILTNTVPAPPPFRDRMPRVPRCLPPLPDGQVWR